MQKSRTEKGNRSTGGAVASGVLVLSVSGILVKLVGLLFKIPLTNLIGESGMGYFNSAYTIYTFFYILSTAGLPIALSIMVSAARASGNFGQCERIFRLALTVFISVGMLLSLAMAAGAGAFSALISNPKASMSITAMAPTLFFVSVISAYRGYFQGCMRMLPTAVSQLIEAVGKLTFGILFATLAKRAGCDAGQTAAFAVCGITLASALSMLWLILAGIFIRKEKREYPAESCDKRGETRLLLARLIKTALPITVSSAVISLSGLLDLAVVMRRLIQTGMSGELANAVYGAYTSMAVPLFNMPAVLITPVTAAAVPFVAGALAANDRRRANEAVKNAFRYATIISLPASLGMSVMAKPVLTLFFGAASAGLTAPLLSVLSLSVVFVAYSNLGMSLMQACGIMKAPVLSMLAGSAVKLVGAWVLIGRVGMAGTPASTLLCYITIAVINFIIMEARMKIKTGIPGTMVLPLFSAIICALSAVFIYGAALPLGNTPACLLAVSTAAVIYLLLIIGSGFVKLSEIKTLVRG